MKLNQPISFRDVTLYCVVCGDAFTFTPSQQIEYADRGWPEPRRCPKCRHQRRKGIGLDPKQYTDIDETLKRAQAEIRKWQQH
jgi:hypothetical protein